jgi:sugar lactone lactonase YvrE
MSAGNGDLLPVLWSPAQLELGEGPRWIDDRLVLVDILSGRLLEASGDRAGQPLRTIAALDVPLGAVAAVAGEPDTWIVAAGQGVAFLDRAGILDWLGQPAADRPVPCRMNDAVCDPQGRFWAGSMAWDCSIGAGALYRVDHDGTVTQVLDGITIPNGPAFSADGRLMYLADSARKIVHRFSVDPVSGDLSEASRFVEFTEGDPDGMAIDVDGNVWIALWGAGSVQQFSPEGTQICEVTLPVLQPSAPCLGGRDGRTLFVTTARYGLGAQQAAGSGDVFAVRVPIPGLPANVFGTAR